MFFWGWLACTVRLVLSTGTLSFPTLILRLVHTFHNAGCAAWMVAVETWVAELFSFTLSVLEQQRCWHQESIYIYIYPSKKHWISFKQAWVLCLNDLDSIDIYVANGRFPWQRQPESTIQVPVVSRFAPKSRHLHDVRRQDSQSRVHRTCPTSISLLCSSAPTNFWTWQGSRRGWCRLTDLYKFIESTESCPFLLSTYDLYST